MKKITLLLILSLCLTPYLAMCQISIGGKPESWKISRNLPNIPIKQMPNINREKLAIEDADREKNNDPPRFGFKHYVTFSPNNAGIWIDGVNDSKIWLIKLKCPDALSINLLFSKLHLQEGSKMFVYSEATKQVIGAFTDRNNKGSLENPRGFGTGLVYGDEIIVELNVPKHNQGLDIVEFKSIVHGYRLINIPEFYKAKLSNVPTAFGASSECQVNVNCLEGQDWQTEKKGVALIIIGGAYHCTGSLVNNTCEDGKLYFLTAHHCLLREENGPNGPEIEEVGEPLDWTFVWNYESPTCENPSPSEEPSNQTTFGAFAHAGLDKSYTDFLLVELTESPHHQSPPIEVYYNGWSRTEDPKQGGVGIHHPQGDLKKISTHDMIPIANTNCTPYMDNYWEINWTLPTVSGKSVVEQGSSGSPLFMKNKKIIGQLEGMGDPFLCPEPLNFCETETQEIVYGRFSKSWDYYATSNSTQLAIYLDRLGLNPLELDGSYTYRCNNNVLDISGVLNTTFLYNNVREIRSDATIVAIGNIKYHAYEKIELKPGFETEIGSFFLAEIKPCTPVNGGPCEKRDVTRKSISLSTDENSSSKTVASLFPNPANNMVTLKFNSILNNMDIYVDIKDIMGKGVANYQFNSNEINQNVGFDMDLSSFVNGVYFVSIKRNGSFETHKLVISK